MDKDVNFGIKDSDKVIVENAVEDAINSLGGFELVEFTFKKLYGKLNLTAFIWKKSGISLDDCEFVHNSISPVLDKFDDMFASDYVLNVSSCGLDRKIVSNDDFRRALDTDVEAFDTDSKSYHGVLIAYSDEDFTLRSGGKYGKDIVLSRKNITKVQPFIRF